MGHRGDAERYFPLATHPVLFNCAISSAQMLDFKDWPEMKPRNTIDGAFQMPSYEYGVLDEEELDCATVIRWALRMPCYGVLV